MEPSEITPAQRRELAQALLSAFPSKAELAGMLLFQLGEHLARISDASALPHVIMELIIWAEARDSLSELLDAATAANPTNRRLQVIAAQLKPSVSPIQADEQPANQQPAASAPPPHLRLLSSWIGHTAVVTAVAVLPDGRRAISASADETLKLWDLDSATELRSFRGHTDAVGAVALLPDSRRAISASHDKTLKLWDLDNGAELRSFQGNTVAVMAVAVLPGGRRAISASYQTLKLWDLVSGAELRSFQGHTALVMAVAALPDGRRAISASTDKTLKLWDLISGAELRSFLGHTAAVTAVAVLPDGRRAISAADKTLKLWDLDSGALLAGFAGDQTLMACAVAPDGRTIVAGEQGGRVLVLRLEGGED